MAFSVVLTFVTGEAITSCETSHGDNLLRDVVTELEDVTCTSDAFVVLSYNHN